jgi:hypothetical protein
MNSGTDGNTFTFSDSEPLTIYNTTRNIFNFKVIDGSSGFANTDTVQVISAINIQNSIGGNYFPPTSFKVNDVIQNGVANAIIIEANSTVTNNALTLKIKPLSNDLKSANTIKF